MDIKPFLLARHNILNTAMKGEQIISYLITKPAHIQYLLGLEKVSHFHRDLFVLAHLGQIYTLHSPLMALPTYVGSIAKCHSLSSAQPLAATLKTIIGSMELYADLDDLTVRQHHQLQIKLGTIIKAAPSIIDELRLSKDQLELRYLAKACRITGQVMRQTLKNLKIGSTELEIKNDIENLRRASGAIITPEFEPIVAVGPHSAVPHHEAGNRKIKARDVVLIDFGCQVHGYWADMTRTIQLGKPTVQYNRVETAVKLAYAAAKHTIIKTQNPALADAAATERLIKSGFPAMPHTTGHGIGLAVHEPPSLNRFADDLRLAKSAVFTIEPGIYLPKAFGYRHENTLSLVNGKLTTLTV